MPVQIRDHFLLMEFGEAEAQWPGLTERIFNAARDISPAQLNFELDEIDAGFNMNNTVDDETWVVISTVLSRVLEEPRILLTRGDTEFTYYRFCHLFFLYEAVRQGIYKEVMTESGVVYEVSTPSAPTKYQPRRQFFSPPYTHLFWK